MRIFPGPGPSLLPAGVAPQAATGSASRRGAATAEERWMLAATPATGSGRTLATTFSRERGPPSPGYRHHGVAREGEQQRRIDFVPAQEFADHPGISSLLTVRC